MGALAYANGQGTRWMRETPGVLTVLKAAVTATSTTDAEAITMARALGSEFLELVRPSSLVDRIVGMREVPPNVSILRVTGGASAMWIGEGAPKPIGKFSTDRISLTFDKLISIVVATSELIQNSTPAAEKLFGLELAAAVAAFGDKAFIDPSYGPVANIAPGAITYGAPSMEASGTSTGAVQNDIKAFYSNFVAAGGLLENAILITHPRTASALGRMTDEGGLVFPDIGARGGSLGGVPALTSSACGLSGSPGETFMALVDPGAILVTDEDNVDIDIAHQAAVQMNDAPSAGAQSLVSLWQNGLMAVKAERSITWRRARDSGVAVLRGITY